MAHLVSKLADRVLATVLPERSAGAPCMPFCVCVKDSSCSAPACANRCINSFCHTTYICHDGCTTC